MKTRRLTLSEAEILVLEGLLERLRSDLTCLRLQAVLLYGRGVPVAEIRKKVNCSRSSLMSWCQIYRTTGVHGLVDGRQGGNNAKLSSEQMIELKQRMITYTPWMVFGEGSATPEGRYWTAKDLYRALKLWYGITYQSRSSYYNLLLRLGFNTVPNSNTSLATYAPGEISDSNPLL